MTAASKWVAAGSSAAVLAGGLFLGVPTAAAAPGDAACQQAFNQYESALGAAGITQATVADLESAVDAAEAAYVPVQQVVDDAEAALAAAEAQLADDEAAKDAAEEALEEAQETGDPEAIEAAQIAYETADEARGDSRDAVELRESELNAATVSPELIQARDALNAAVANFEALLAAVSLDEASATSLMGLFEGYLTACDPDSPGVDPVVPPVTPPVVPPVAPPVNAPGSTPVNAPGGTPGNAPGSTTPAVAGAVSATPAGGGTGAVATNKGLNVQTAVEAEPNNDPGLALLAGLLAAGIAVPAAVARRLRRMERTRK
ncbi:hypothetical protein ACHMXB_11835 [Arthrobacter sp. UC242_113]|uniref:hypothetical protein n=1 Tax=Arthrobacter sp. UC242_113 TaxID=3374550 RepID=UPI003756B078